jgi:hypothetical protein
VLAWLDVESLAYLHAALRYGVVLTSLPVALSPVLAPGISALAAEGRREAEAAAAELDLARREIRAAAEMGVEEARGALAAWGPMEKAAEYAAQHLRRAERAYALGETGLTELLLSVVTSLNTIHDERMARLGAHESIARLRIDAHELWAPGGDDHDHEGP